MNETSTKFLVINWKWDDDLPYPTFIPKESNKDTCETCEFDVPILLIPAVEQDAVTGDDEAYQLKKKVKPTCYVLPTKVDLRYPAGISHIKDIKIDFFNKLFAVIGKKAPVGANVQVAFLFHQGDGFDDEDDLPEIIQDGMKKSKMSHNVEKKVDFFGKGQGIMYNQHSGLLPLSSSYFRYKGKPEKKIGWFQNTIELKYLKIERFNSVWNHYWTFTRKRIEDLRKYIYLAQIGHKAAESSKEIAIGYAQNLLKNLLCEDKNQRFKLPKEKYEWDFSECSDLKEWLHEGNTRFPSYAIWLEQMGKFSQGQDADFSKINEGFDELVTSLYRS